jgi:hypothetical protein
MLSAVEKLNWVSEASEREKSLHDEEREEDFRRQKSQLKNNILIKNKVEKESEK